MATSERKLVGKVEVKSCGTDSINIGVSSKKSLIVPQKMKIDRDMLPEDYEPGLYNVSGSVTFTIKATRKKVKSVQ